MTARGRWAGWAPARRVMHKGRDGAVRRSWRLPACGHRVALTFDDGPDPVYTPAILDTLAELEVPATFFCVGARVDRHPDIVARMLREGHTVASHGASHPDYPTLGHRAVLQDIRGGRDALRRCTGGPVRLFRPPHGDGALRTGAGARALGMRTWLWTVDPEDWRPGISSEDIAAACADLRPGDVIVLHDGLEQPTAPEALDRSATVAALPAIVSAGRTRGLSFAGLPS